MTDRRLNSTQLDLRSVVAPELPVDRVFTSADLSLDGDDYRLIGDATFHGTVRKDEVRYHLTGRVRAILEVGCGRCLEPYTLPVDTSVDLTYLPDPAGLSDAEAEVELTGDDLTTAYYREQTIDLAEMLREQFYLALPMRLLCREDCQGLCPQCGTNLNQSTCGCDVRWEDPRLASLRALLKKPEGRADS